jgi:hypothetical protein
VYLRISTFWSDAGDPIASIEQRMGHVSLNDASSSAFPVEQSWTSSSIACGPAATSDQQDNLKAIEFLTNLMQPCDQLSLQFTFVENPVDCFEECPSLCRFWKQCQTLDEILNGDSTHSGRFAPMIKLVYALNDLSSLCFQFLPLFDKLNGTMLSDVCFKHNSFRFSRHSACKKDQFVNNARLLVSWSLALNPHVGSSSADNSLTLWRECLSMPSCKTMFSNIWNAIQTQESVVDILPSDGIELCLFVCLFVCEFVCFFVFH